MPLSTFGSLFQLNGGAVELGGNVTAKSSFIYGTSATINGTFNPGKLAADVSGDFLLNVGGAINVGDDSSITSGTNINLNGSISGDEVTLTAAGAINFNGPVTLDELTTHSSTVMVAGPISGKEADFKTSSDFQLAAGGVVQLDGFINAPTADVKVSGLATVPGTSAIVVNDSAVAKSFDFKSTGDFLLDVGASLTSSADSKINANNGGITLDGAISGKDVSLTATNDVFVNQTISASHLTIDAQNENIAAAIAARDVDLHPEGDLDLSAQGSFTLSGHLNVNAGGNINLVGPVSAATDVMLKANNTISTFDLSAGNKFSADATVVTLNGNISAKSMDFRGTLTLAVGESLSAGDSIHADNASSMALNDQNP